MSTPYQWLLLFILMASIVSATPIYILSDKLNKTMINDKLINFYVNGNNLPIYVQSVYFVNYKIQGKYCGLCLSSGKIFISITDECDGYDFDWIYFHEIRHAYWFKNMSFMGRFDYCKSVNLTGGYCREHFIGE